MTSTQNIWNYFQKTITHQDLVYIAEADCGFDKDLHFKRLNEILESAKLPSRLEWEPKEVLSLIRWEDYSKDDTRLLNIIFFCSFILLATAENEEDTYYIEGQTENIILAIDTATLLGQNEIEYLYEFLEYLIPKLNIQFCEEDFLYFHLGHYITAKLLNKPEQVVDLILDKTIKAEDAVSIILREDLNDNIMAYSCFDQKVHLWEKHLEHIGVEIENKRLTSK